VADYGWAFLLYMSLYSLYALGVQRTQKKAFTLPVTSTKPTTLRLSPTVKHAMLDLARRSKRDFSSIANEMLEEAVRMRHIPGIVFADGPAGRRARLAGTGLDVFEIVRAYKEVDENWTAFRRVYHWLTDVQLRTALAYWAAYPHGIEERLAREDELSPAEILHRHPYAAS